MNQQGIFHKWRVALFGERAERLRESTSSAHGLSYLLVTVQSAAVVLALGHQQIRLVLSGDPAIVLISGLAVFLLVATVWAADLCLLATLRRLPVLMRNRQTWALCEHLLYLAFVLAVEGSTLALVLAVLDTDPLALVRDAPIVPAGGWMFGATIGARAALTCWTAVQLWIVRGKLPPQWSTLLLEARELLGGKAQQVMSSLNLDDASLAALFDAYAQMSRPPVRVARWWNRGLLAREAAALAEEDRQRAAVVAALSAFDRLDVSAAADLPTGPGTPISRSHTNSEQAAGSTPQHGGEIVQIAAARGMGAHRPAALKRPASVRAKKVRAEREQRVAGMLEAEPGISTREIARRLRCSESHALELRRVVEARRSVAIVPQEVAQ